MSDMFYSNCGLLYNQDISAHAVLLCITVPFHGLCSSTKCNEWNSTWSQSWDQNGFERNCVQQSVNFLNMFSWIVFTVRYVLCHASYIYFSFITAVSQSMPSVPTCSTQVMHCLPLWACLTWMYFLFFCSYQQIIRAVHCQVLSRSWIS